MTTLDFRARLMGAIPDDGTDIAALHGCIDKIMGLVREAIETPQVSGEIDTWLVRTMLGKQGTRADAADAYEHALAGYRRASDAMWKTAGGAVAAAEIGGDRRVEYAPDPRIDIFCRVYETERNMGPNATPPDMAARLDDRRRQLSAADDGASCRITRSPCGNRSPTSRRR